MKKRKIWKSVSALFLALGICMCMGQAQPAVQASIGNIALNKTVTTSSVRPARSELTGELAVDGIDDDESSRWSSKMATGKGENEGSSEDGTVEQWIQVDLGAVYDFSEIYISWEAAYAKSYKIQISEDGDEYTDLYINENAPGGKETISEEEFLTEAEARFVRILCLEPFKDTWGYSIYEIQISGTIGDNPNLALNKSVSYSGVEGGKDGEDWHYPQFVGEMAVDGDASTRWSADKTDDQWLIVDLGEVYKVSQVTVNFFREPLAYTVEVSENGEDYTTVLEVADNPMINVENVRKIVFEKQNVRYIKINQTAMFTNPQNGQKYGGSIYEVEAYQYADAEIDEKDAADILAEIEASGPVIPVESTGQISFPEEITEGFDVEIYGSDYKPIIGLDGSYNQPLSDKDVHLMYKVTNKEDEEDTAVSTEDNIVHVTGRFQDPGTNEAPAVIPSLQEWHGGQGQYKLTESSRIIYNDAELESKAEMLSGYLKNLLGMDIAYEAGTEPAAGDIYLCLTDAADIEAIGEEGYYLDITDFVTVESSDEVGAFYGGVTVVQALYLNADTMSINKGTARDYPKYEVRSIMLDIARSEIQLDYIEEITEVLPFFKINEISLHINDDRGDKITNTDIGSEENIVQTKDLSSFRVENDKNIGAHSYQISKEDYIAYQKAAEEYGVTVITEIDTPAHSAVFSLLPEMVDHMYDVRHLKISADSSAAVEDVELYQPTIDFIDELIGEFVGDGPGDAIVQPPVFNFGTDEYDTSVNHAEAMQQYINHYTEFLQSRGYEARAWASTDGASGFKGYITPQNKEVTYYLWAPYWADVKKTLANGNPLINCSGSWLYIVPGGNNNYHDRLDIESLYNDWSVNNITTTRGSGGAVIPISHPQLRGASVVLWNDDGFLEDGISDFDIYDRLKEAFPLIAERTWYGEKTEGQDYESFAETGEYLTQTGPSSNPARYVASISDTIAEYTFENVSDSTVADRSGNGYDGTLEGAEAADGKSGQALSLDGDSWMSLPFDTVGFPNSVSLDLYVDSETGDDAVLFGGEDGSIHINQKNKAGEYTGKLGYERDGYTYVFDYEVPRDEWINLQITAGENGTQLYVNDKYIGAGQRTEFGQYTKKDLSRTMILPTEKIGEGIVGMIDNLQILNYAAEPENIAVDAVNAAASNVFSDQFGPEKAVDGSLTTRWATTNDTTTATLEIEFADEVSVNGTGIVEYKGANNHIDSYTIEYWNGTEWAAAFSDDVSDGEKQSVPGVTNGYSFSGYFDTVTASKFRLNLTAAYRPTIYEFELYYISHTETVDKSVLESVILKAEALSREDYTVSSWNEFAAAYQKAEEVYESEDADQEEVNEAAKALEAQTAALEERAGTTQAEEVLADIEAEGLSGDAFTPESWEIFVQAKEALESAVEDCTDISVKQMQTLIDSLKEARSGLKAAEQPEEKTIVSIKEMEGIEAAFGTAAEDLALPEQAVAELSDGSTAELAVEWTCEDYDGNTPGTYRFTGTLILPEGILNPDHITACAAVTVKEEPGGDDNDKPGTGDVENPGGSAGNAGGTAGSSTDTDSGADGGQAVKTGDAANTAVLWFILLTVSAGTCMYVKRRKIQ